MRLFPLLAGLILAATPALAAPDAHRAAATLHRGVNVLGYDPLWKPGGTPRFTPPLFGVIRRGGFDHVRVVLQAFAHMDADDRLDPAWLAKLDTVVKDATAAGLSVILDEHDFNKCSDDPDACAPKLAAFWRQVGQRYRAAPASVMFELLNEPHGKLDAARWNAMIAAILPVVRATNPDRTLLIGPTRWNNVDELPNLKLPDADRNIIVEFHYYEPFRFTHQGASWTDNKDLHGIPFTPADQARVRGDIARAAAWGHAHDRPVLLGEFGAYDGSGTPMADIARYDGTVARAAEANGLPWTYWQFDSDFVLYDIAHDHWIAPIHDALVATDAKTPG